MKKFRKIIVSCTQYFKDPKKFKNFFYTLFLVILLMMAIALMIVAVKQGKFNFKKIFELVGVMVGLTGALIIVGHLLSMRRKRVFVPINTTRKQQMREEFHD